MTCNQLAAAGFCALLLTACADDDAPSATSSPTATSSPREASPFPALRVSGVDAQDRAQAVDLEPNGVITAVTWTDQLGANTFVLRDIGEEQVDPALLLQADHVVQVGDEVRVLRQVRDDVTDCDVERKSEFVDQALQVRDDDGDRIGEVVFAYRQNCSGDPSASSLKVLALEDGEKYILRGSSTNEVDTRGGSAVPEPAPDLWPAGTYEFLLALYTEVQPE